MELVSIERNGRVAVVTLDRPEQRNALDDEMLSTLARHCHELDIDPEIGCIVIAGSESVFAAGADIRALLDRTPVESHLGGRVQSWAVIRSTRTPKVAAVSGLCLGGGCELAMSADIVVASETARFGLPETKLGLIPGAGGTQMLPRAIGKAKAMDMILTGRLLDADEAERAGLISRIAPQDSWLETAVEIASVVARGAASTQQLAKWAVDSAAEMDFSSGLAAERGAFASLLADDVGREGLTAFLEKRRPSWHGEISTDGEVTA